MISKWSILTEHWIATEYFVFCSSTVVYERQLYYSLIFIEHAIALLVLCQKKGSCMLEGKKGYIRRAFFHNRNSSLLLSLIHTILPAAVFTMFQSVLVVFTSASYSWISYQSLRNSLLTYFIFNKK